MTEIELKAHVFDRGKLIENLNSFAKYEKTVTKDDTYFHLEKKEKSTHKNQSEPKTTDGNENSKKNYISARIRRQTEKTEKGTKTTNFLTYKKKELKSDSKGISIEVNDEKETEISDTEAVEILFKDIGFVPALKKHKEVMIFSAQTEYGKATLELCNVQRLGDFIEIEILSGKNDAQTVEKLQGALKKLLSECKIPEKDIEKRYYSEMLKELDQKK